MKTKSTWVALLAGLVISSTAYANVALNTLYTSTEVGVAGSGLGATTPASFNISSEAVTTATTGVYEYEYNIPNLTSDPLSVFDVRMLISAAGIVNIGNSSGSTSTELQWTYNNTTSTGPLLPTGATLWFDSTLLPVFGQADAQDNGQWQDQSVVVPNIPNVPDGSLTMALLGGAFVGMQGLRRKFAK